MSDSAPPPTKDDLLAILRANRDLGPEYDEHTADQLMSLFRSAHSNYRPDRDSVPDSDDWDTQRRSRRRSRSQTGTILALSIPLAAIVGNQDHGLGLFAVLGLAAVALVVTNLSHR